MPGQRLLAPISFRRRCHRLAVQRRRKLVVVNRRHRPRTPARDSCVPPCAARGASLHQAVMYRRIDRLRRSFQCGLPAPAGKPLPRFAGRRFKALPVSPRHYSIVFTAIRLSALGDLFHSACPSRSVSLSVASSVPSLSNLAFPARLKSRRAVLAGSMRSSTTAFGSLPKRRRAGPVDNAERSRLH
jgi:hypothetical protein